MAKVTLLDIAKLNGNDRVVGLIEENLTYAPELNIFPSRQIAGTSYYTVKRTAFPSVGFTGVNEGIAAGKSSFEKQLHQAYVLRGAIECDLAAATAYEGGMAELEMIEASGVAKASLIKLGSQIWYGTSSDAKGFPGIKSFLAKNSTITVDAGGSTANTASSVYFVKFGTQDVSLVFGNNTTLQLDPFSNQQLSDANGGKYAGRVSNLTAWTGLQVGNANCIGRILNLTEDSGKGLTDSLISQLLQKFPVGYQPDAIFVNRRSRGQLQRSRSVTIFSGNGGKAGSNLENIAPVPTEAFGIPIITTDSILSTDAIE